MSKTIINEFDTIHFNVERKYCRYDSGIPDNCSILGAFYKIYPASIYFNVSCKLFSSATDLGAITLNNFGDLSKIFEKSFGIIIPKEYLYERVCPSRFDVKKDRFMVNEPQHYISLLRNFFKRNTRHFDLYKHCNLTYPNGLDLIPKAQKKYKLSIYNKGCELLKSDNKEYRKQFDFEFLNSLNYCLRSEVQLKCAETIKEVFHIPKYQKHTFENLFNCNTDIVAEQLGNVFNYALEV